MVLGTVQCACCEVDTSGSEDVSGTVLTLRSAPAM